MRQHGEPTAEQRPEPREVVIPLVDHDRAGLIYDKSIHRWSSLAGLAGALVVGWLGYAVGAGALPIAGLGQWAVGGPAVGAFTGAGVGAALGALAGGLIALYRMPPRNGQD